MRVDINNKAVYIEVEGTSFTLTMEEAASLAFAISAAIQDDNMAFEIADMVGCTRCPHINKKGDALWAEELTRQHKQDVEEEKA